MDRPAVAAADAHYVDLLCYFIELIEEQVARSLKGENPDTRCSAKSHLGSYLGPLCEP